MYPWGTGIGPDTPTTVLTLEKNKEIKYKIVQKNVRVQFVRLG